MDPRNLNLLSCVEYASCEVGGRWLHRASTCWANPGSGGRGPHALDGATVRIAALYSRAFRGSQRPDGGLRSVDWGWSSASTLVGVGAAVCKMDAQTQLPTFTLAVYVGVLAVLVVLAVAFTMLRIYAYRHRLSTVTISASYDADAELADTNSNALIATTLSALGSPLSDFPVEPPTTSKTDLLSSFGSSRWEQVRSFVAGIRSRGMTAWSSLRLSFASRRATKTSNRKADHRGSQTEIDIVTPCDIHAKPPLTPNTCQHSSKFQLGLFRSPTSGDVGMI